MSNFRLIAIIRNIKDIFTLFLLSGVFSAISITLKTIIFDIIKRLKIKIYLKIKFPSTNVEISVLLSNYSFWKAVEKGLWEQNIIKFLKNTIKKGQTIIDIGAHIGAYALLCSKLMEDEGKVIAFEPNKYTYNILIRNIRLNNCQNIKTEGLIVSNKKAKIKLYIQEGDPSDSTSSIIPNESLKHFKHQLKYEIIDTTTIDDYCKDNDIIPDGIIMDVEGAEKFVLEGCKNVISKYAPWILVEFHSHRMEEINKIKLWNEIIKNSKEVIFIHDKTDNNQKQYGKIIKKLPNLRTFNILIKF